MMRKLLGGGAGTVEDQDEVKCVHVIASLCSAPIPGLPSHWTVHSFIRGFGGICSYGRRG